MSGLNGLNDEQQAAVLHTEGPLLILAGAGSGKTRTITHRIAYLIDEKGVNPWNILAITFTNKAAQEMRDRVNNLVGYGADQIWVMTFHATCIRILRRNIHLLGFDEHFTVYDADDQKTVMKAVCKKLNIDTKRYKEKTLLNEISNAKDNLVGVQEYENSVMGDFTKAPYARCYREYQETLQRSNALDFDDIICMTVRLFKEYPEVLEKYQERFKYIHVDEYQDTNYAQFELVRLLAGKYRNLCVVGDDDQSIYKFRGANIRNILDFEMHYDDATVIKLEENYRSTGYILKCANAVIRNNIGRKDKTLRTEKADGEKVKFIQCENAYEEAETICSDVRRGVRDGGSYNDYAVLYRTNAQARIIEERFVTAGIPYNVVGGVNFYARAEIKDILAYLKTIDNGTDEVALRRIINIPKRGIGATSLGKVAEFADIRDITLYEAMTRADEIPGLGKTAYKIKAFTDMIGSFRGYLDIKNVPEMIKHITEQIGYEEYLRDNDEESADDRIANIDELITKAVVYDEQKNAENEIADLTGFLEEVALVSDIDGANFEDGRVLLMTLHSAKGLEFPNVYIAGMEDGLFPSYMSVSSDSDDDLEEERRLAYVGITRAEEHLTLLCAKQRMLRGEMQYNAISRFVKEIPSEYLDGYIPKSRNSYIDRDDDRRLSGGYGDSYGSGYGDSYGAGYDRGSVSRSYDTGRKAGEAVGKATLKAKPYSLGLSGLKKGADTAASEPDYKVGDRVRHIKFGAGTVTAMVKETRDYKVTVDFDASGTKVMYAAFAKLVRC